MNFSTVPPCSIRDARMRANASASVRRTTSGLRELTLAVDPTMSATRTVASLRSSGIGEV